MRRLALLAGVAAALMAPAPAAATVFSVTTLADLDGASCGGSCSLRQAINAANTTVSIDGTGDVILLPTGTLERNPVFPAVRITAPVVLAGTGARTTTIVGSPNPGFSSRALTVASSTPIAVELRDLSVASGLVEASAALPAQGGGIHVTAAHLTLRRVTVYGNRAVDARGATTAGSVLGGGIFTDGALTLDEVTLRDNRATGTWASGNNTISAAGGGAYVRGASTSIRNSTVADNAADGGPGLGYAGGLELMGEARLEGVTVTGNRVDGAKGASGGNLASGFVAPTVSGSLIADGLGSATSGNCTRALASGGGNVEDADQCGFSSPSDRAVTDPQLGPLQDNGGPTDTRAPLPGSRAIDLDPVCAVDVDQRGTERPQGAACDAGAVEAVVAPPGVLGSIAPPEIGSVPPTSGFAPALGAPAFPTPRRCTLGLAGDARRLEARIACDRAGSVRLTGRMSIRPGKARPRSVTRLIRLSSRTVRVRANAAVVVRIAVPRAASRAVRRRDRVSVTLTAKRVGVAASAGPQTARIARLRSGATTSARRPAASRAAGRAMTVEARAWTPIASGGLNTTDQVGLARTSDGVLHVAWRRRAAGQDLLHTPVAPSVTQLALDAQDDRVDAVATMSDDQNVVRLSATQGFPGLTLKGGNATMLARRGFRVLDNGRPIGRASVRVAGRTLTTRANGYARARLRPGSYTATASKPRYVDASLPVRIR